MLPEIGVVFDAGTGFFRVRDLIQTNALDVFMSHVHLDHSIGLTFMLDVLFGKKVERVTGPLRAREGSGASRASVQPGSLPVQPDFEFRAPRFWSTFAD